MTPDTILLAGGGTGGHVFPMIAVADELRRLLPRLRLVFVGTERGIESQVVPERGYPLELLDILPLRGGGIGGALQGIRRAAKALPSARSLLGRYEPKVVFSIGGYAAGPVALAARTLGIPVALMEPNSVIGLANRLVAPLVARAYTAFPSVEKHFAKGSVLRTGVALRRGFEPRLYGYQGGTLNVLVLGGSQGAKSLNETVPHALGTSRTPLTVVHQAGKGNDELVRQRYEALGATEHVQVVPFIADMPRALAAADLVIGRAGAGAVSEICAVGRPSLLIPYPFASGNHQYKNALSLEQAGAARCIAASEATVQRLGEEIDALAKDPARLRSMAKSAQNIGRPDAAETVALDLLEIGNLPLDEMDGDEDLLNNAPNGNSTKLPSEVH
jgi:UDP-N-acetylglucosamine--N-acetylmuramyl-(pentapeptide) pyrophosphoryl-undecaprenol N-acetylglucosamine transferase